jgi:hypothetical protein
MLERFAGTNTLAYFARVIEAKKSFITSSPGANVIKLFLTQWKHLSDAPLKCRFLAVPANIRQGWKGLPGTNALAYYEKS